MNRDIQSSWMFSPKSFVSLLGAEYGLMRDAGVLWRFYVSSVLILIILVLTGVSIEYALDLLFHNIAVEIVLTIFFCLLFSCIYIFLLNTFAKENRKQNGILNLSNIIRTGFVAFMGFLIAQPLIVMLYTATITPAIQLHKKEVLIEHTAKINALMKADMEKLAQRQHDYMQQKKSFGTLSYEKELRLIANRLQSMKDKAAMLNQSTQQTIGRSSFFLFRVQKVNSKYMLPWLLTLLVILVFLTPGYLIYTISSQHEYYILKKAREKELVVAAYHEFSAQYITMFNDEVAIFSRYEDPPFNTVRIQPRVPASMNDFLQKYLHNG